MTEALQTSADHALVLASPEWLSLKRASRFLVGRERARTPVGAVEYLEIASEVGHAAYEGRVQLSIDLMTLYSELFPREYGASGSPAFSTQKEHEFYRLVARRLFPLDTSPLDDDPLFVYPFIPVEQSQQHDWINGCCPFDKLQTVFKLALCLQRNCFLQGSEPGAWRKLGLKREPAPPVKALGWTHFQYLCAVEASPLRYFPAVFNLMGYKTGSVWLDCPPGARMGFSWNGEEVAKLLLDRLKADRINAGVLALDSWLDEDPARVLRAVELWDRAALMEAQDVRSVDMDGVRVNFVDRREALTR